MQFKKISVGSATQTTDKMKDTFTRGAWVGFFDGLRAGLHSAELAKNTKRCRQKRSENGSLHSDSDESVQTSRNKKRQDKEKWRKQERHATDGSRKVDGKYRSGSAGEGSAWGSWAKCIFKEHFPLQKDRQT
jgi:hypothetical protein